MDIVRQLVEALGGDVVFGPDDFDPAARMSDQGHTAEHPPLAVCLPRSTAEVSTILRLCNAAGAPVSPQGGLTGLAGGATPGAGCVVLALDRMNRIEAVDGAAGTMIAQAGVPLQRVQEAAEAEGLYFAVDLGARGSCQIGGNVATNAGGNHVLRYGMMREQVLGLEAVLADGVVISAMNVMLKNNAGYDLKQLFIGSEGTLGVITRVVLRLHPAPGAVSTALCAAADYDAVLAMLARVKGSLGGGLIAFEVMWPSFYDLGTEGRGLRAPLPTGPGLRVIVEAASTDAAGGAATFEAAIADLVAAGVAEDAVIAQSERERRDIWEIRELSGELGPIFGGAANFDISVPVSRIGVFVDQCDAALRARWPEVVALFFGHAADGNIHIAVHVPGQVLPREAVDELVFAVVGTFEGSISAEHGIGLLKRPYLQHSRNPEELALMRTLKTALDPKGILNPGKVLPDGA